MKGIGNTQNLTNPGDAVVGSSFRVCFGLDEIWTIGPVNGLEKPCGSSCTDLYGNQSIGVGLRRVGFRVNGSSFRSAIQYADPETNGFI